MISPFPLYFVNIMARDTCDPSVQTHPGTTILPVIFNLQENIFVNEMLSKG
jgi:hypothetical protein